MMGTDESYVFLDFAFDQVKVVTPYTKKNDKIPRNWNLKAGRVVIKLFKDVVPITAENFRCLCTGEKGIGEQGKPLHYKGSRIHRVIAECMIQGGDIIYGDGSGGESIYGEYFENENYKIKHTEEGIIGTCNNGLNKNSSQFYITTNPCLHLDDQNVAFGKVIKGLDIIKEMADIPRLNDVPQNDIRIEDCGELKANELSVEENDGTADIYPPWPNDWNESLNPKEITNVINHINDSGNVYFNRGNFPDAERKYKKAIRYIDWYLEKNRTHNNGEKIFFNQRNNALLNLTAARLKISKYKEALQHCNEVIKISSRNGKAYYRRACANIGLKEYDEALKDLKIAYKLHPNDKNIKIMFEATKNKRQAYLKRQKIVCLKIFNNNY